MKGATPVIWILFAAIIAALVMFGVVAPSLGIIQKAFADIFGLGGQFGVSGLEKAIQFTQLRCTSGCNNIVLRSEYTDLSSEFCDNVPSEFKKSTEQKICGWDSMQYPVFYKTGKSGMDKVSVSNAGVRCLIRYGASYESKAQISCDARTHDLVYYNFNSAQSSKQKDCFMFCGPGFAILTKQADEEFISKPNQNVYIMFNDRSPVILGQEIGSEKYTDLSPSPTYTILQFQDPQKRIGAKSTPTLERFLKEHICAIGIGQNSACTLGLRFDIDDVTTQHLIFETSSLSSKIYVSLKGSYGDTVVGPQLKKTIECGKGTQTEKLPVKVKGETKGELTFELNCQSKDIGLQYTRNFWPLYLDSSRTSYKNGEPIDFFVILKDESGTLKDTKVNLRQLVGSDMHIVIGECLTDSNGMCSIPKDASSFSAGKVQFQAATLDGKYVSEIIERIITAT